MKLKRILILALLAMCIVGFTMSTVCAASITVQSQGWTGNDCGPGTIEFFNGKDLINSSNITPGQTLYLDIPSNATEVDFYSDGRNHNYGARINKLDLIPNGHITAYVWFYSKSGYDNKIGIDKLKPAWDNKKKHWEGIDTLDVANGKFFVNTLAGMVYKWSVIDKDTGEVLHGSDLDGGEFDIPNSCKLHELEFICHFEGHSINAPSNTLTATIRAYNGGMVNVGLYHKWHSWGPIGFANAIYGSYRNDLVKYELTKDDATHNDTVSGENYKEWVTNFVFENQNITKYY